MNIYTCIYIFSLNLSNIPCRFRLKSASLIRVFLTTIVKASSLKTMQRALLLIIKVEMLRTSMEEANIYSSICIWNKLISILLSCSLSGICPRYRILNMKYRLHFLKITEVNFVFVILSVAFCILYCGQAPVDASHYLLEVSR